MPIRDLLVKSIENKMKFGLTADQLVIEKANLTKRADMFHSAGQLTDPEYEEIKGLINAMVATK